jgi:methionyl-tRNA formyltransferase
MKNPRIIFMGTPEFAVATLGSLLINGYHVVGVVTAPDKPAGRGRKVTESPVKIFAERHCLPVLQPVNLKDPVFIKTLGEFNAGIFVVVAFRMLPEVVWKMPPEGTINLHASLLPHYRGAAPINHAIINGETLTGVTTFFINDTIDTGIILLRDGVRIFPSDNAGDLHERLTKYGARLVIRTLMGLAEESLMPLPQSNFLKKDEIPKTAPKIFPENCIIDWNDEPVKIHNLIRGLSPYPGARSFFREGKVTYSFKIFESSPEHAEHQFSPGYIDSDGKRFLRIACKNGFVTIQNLQLEGKNRMNTVEFLKGYKIKNLTIPVS